MAGNSLQGVLKLLDRIPVPVVIANPVTGRILWVNTQLVRLADASHPDQLVGMSPLDFINIEQRGAALADLAKVALGQSPPPVTYELKKLNGQRASVHVASIPMMYEGQPAMLSLVTDVSEMQELIRRLSESEERYRTLLESMLGGVVVVVDERIVYANSALVRNLGYCELSEIEGRSMFEFIAPEMHEAIRSASAGVLKTGTAFPAAPVTLLRIDGTHLETTAATSRVCWDGAYATQTLMWDLGMPEACES